MKTLSNIYFPSEIEKKSKVTNEMKKKFITTKKIEEKYLSLPSLELEKQYKKFVNERKDLVR